MTTTVLAPSCKDHEIQLEIQTLQELREQRADRHQMPHRHQHVEIVWVRNGNGNLDIDLKRYTMGEKTLYCIIPGQLHQLEIDDDAEGYIISFPEYLLNSGNDDFELLYRSGLFHLLMHSPGIRMERDTADEIEEIIRRLYKELYNVYLLRTEIIRRYTSIFLIYLARQFDGAMQMSVQTRNVGLVKNFIALVEKRYMNWKLVKDYASELSVTPQLSQRDRQKDLGIFRRLPYPPTRGAGSQTPGSLFQRQHERDRLLSGFRRHRTFQQIL